MKIAIIHDHLAQNGGAEQVLKVFCDMFPDAPVYVLVYDPRHADPYFARKDIRTSYIQRMPLGVRKYQWYFPLMPMAVESYDLSAYDVVLSTSSSFAKGVLTRPETAHVAYCHTPTRFLWSDAHSYMRDLEAPVLFKGVAQFFLSRLRVWDRSAADRSEIMLSNSQVIRQRIQKYYHRDTEVVYPPIDVNAFSPAPLHEIGNYFFTGGRLVSYKRFDLLVEAFNTLGRPLKIFGTGPEYKKLRAMARGNIDFLGRISTEELRHHYAHCQAFLNPQEEDFGITMIEALASGRPVIAYNKGGAKEIVEDGVNGMLVDYQTWEDFANVIIDFDAQAFDPQIVRKTAERFDVARFRQHIQRIIEEAVAQKGIN